MNHALLGQFCTSPSCKCSSVMLAAVPVKPLIICSTVASSPVLPSRSRAWLMRKDRAVRTPPQR